MIQQIQLVLSPPIDVRIPQSWSYRLYGWLMSQISSEFGEQMHLQGEHPIAHFLCFSPEKQTPPQMAEPTASTSAENAPHRAQPSGSS